MAVMRPYSSDTCSIVYINKMRLFVAEPSRHWEEGIGVIIAGGFEHSRRNVSAKAVKRRESYHRLRLTNPVSIIRDRV